MPTMNLKDHILDSRSASKPTEGYMLLKELGLFEPEYLPTLAHYTMSVIRLSEGRPLTSSIGSLGELLRDSKEFPPDVAVLDTEDAFKMATHLIESAWHAEGWTEYLDKKGYILTTVGSPLVPEGVKPKIDRATAHNPFDAWSNPYDPHSGRALISNRTLSFKELRSNMDKGPEWLRAVNRLEQTAFAINLDILDIARAVELNIKFEGSAKAKASKRRSYKQTLSQAKLLSEAPFYRRITCDYRGRLTDAASRVAHSGDDLQRAMVEFSERATIDAKSMEFLWLHLANCLDIKGSVDDRVTQAKGYRKQIRAWANDPIGTFIEWGQFDSKFQLIRCALEFKYISLPGSINLTSLPISIDQNASAYQHIALLYRDPELARLSNLTDEYCHIYSEIAQVVEHDTGLTHKEMTKVVKAVAMPRVYGGTARSAESKLRKLSEEIPTLSDMIESVMDTPEMIEFRSKRVLKLKGGEIKEIEIDPESAVDFDLVKSGGYAWYDSDDRNKAYMHAYKPRTSKEKYSRASSMAFKELITAVLDALNEIVPTENIFRTTVKRAARYAVKARGSASWVSPSGFPVHCVKHQTERARAILRLDIQPDGTRRHISLSLTKTLDAVAVAKTANAVVPGIVHSLDAAVLHHTANEFDATLPLTCNHDSFSTLAPHVRELQILLSDSLVWAHRTDQLEKITTGFGMPETVSALHTPDQLVATTTNAFN